METTSFIYEVGQLIPFGIRTLRVNGKFGSGGTAVVLDVEDSVSKQKFALKVSNVLERNSMPDQWVGMLKEANFASTSQGCPFLASTIGHCVDQEGRLCILMEAYGESCDVLMGRFKELGEPIPYDLLLRILWALASAVKYLFDRGFLHL